MMLQEALQMLQEALQMLQEALQAVGGSLEVPREVAHGNRTHCPGP